VELKNIIDEMEKQMDFLSTQLQILNGMNSKNDSDNSHQQPAPPSMRDNYPPPVGRSLVGFKKEQVMSSMGNRMESVVNKAMASGGVDQGVRSVNHKNAYNDDNDDDIHGDDANNDDDDGNNGEYSFINKRNIMASINDRMNSTVSSSGADRANYNMGGNNEYNSNPHPYNQYPPSFNGFSDSNPIYGNSNDVNRITPSNNKPMNQFSNGLQSSSSPTYNWEQQRQPGNPNGGPWGRGPWGNGATTQQSSGNNTNVSGNRNNNTKNAKNDDDDDVGGEVDEVKPKVLTEKQLKKQKLIQFRNNRGALDDWSLVHSKHFPESMDDIRCVAIAAGGYICIDDEGCASYHGIPSCVVTAVEKHKCKKLKYISIGPLKKGRYGQYQYYLLKTDGKGMSLMLHY